MGSKSNPPATIWSRWFIPILYLASGLVRSSAPSVIYTLIGLFHAAWGRIPSVRTTLSSILAIVVAILSLVAGNSVYDKKNVNSYIRWLSGGVDYSGTRRKLYVVSDILAIVTSALALLANIIAWAAKRREKKKLEDLTRLEKRREEAHRIDREAREQKEREEREKREKEEEEEKEGQEEGEGKKKKKKKDKKGKDKKKSGDTTTSSSSRRHDSYLTSETNPEDDEETEESEDEKQEEKEGDSTTKVEQPRSETPEIDESPAILRFVAEMPTTRSFFALIVASIAACFMPTILTAPYALFVIISGLYFAHPRRHTTKLNFAKFMTKFGLVMEIYTILYILVTHAFQLYLSYSIVEGKAMKDFSWRHWVGIFHYTEFYNKNGWMICVGYAATLLLFFVLSPSLNCARVIKDSELNEINSRCRLSISAKILVICRKAQEMEKQGKKYGSGFSILAQAMYPHGWKVCWLIIFYMAIMSPGIPAYILILLVMLSSFFSSRRAAEFSIPCLYLYWIIFAGQFFVRICTPLTDDNYDKHSKWFNSFSIGLRSKNYCGLALTLFLMGFLFMVLFERVKGVFKLVEKIGVNAIDKETYDKCVAEVEAKDKKREEKEKKREEKRNAKKKSRKEKQEEKKRKQEEEKKKLEEEGKLHAELSKQELREKKRLERRETLSKLHESFRDGGVRTGEIIRRTLVSLLVLLLRNAYFISLVFLYFAALQETNIINFAFILFFIILLVFPKAPHKIWTFFTAVVDLVLLVRLVWQLHFFSDSSRVTKVIGLEKGTKQHIIASFIWEIVLVTSATIQLFFFAAADQADEARAEEKDKRMKKLAEKEKAKEEGGEAEDKDEEKEELSQSFRSGISVSGTLESLAAANDVELLGKIKNIAMFLLERCGVILCICCWLFVGILMPISAVSLFFVFLACLGSLIFFHAKDAMKHFKRVWAIILVIQAIFLFAEYVYQFSDLHDYLIDVYEDSSVSDKISLDEIGLVTLLTSKRMYLGLLPYLASFVLTAIQLRFFRAAGSVSLSENTLPYPVSGALDFVCRVILEYAPIFLYIYLATELIRIPSAIHLAILFFMMFGRLFPRGFDVTLAIIMWLSVFLILGTLAFNLRAFDRYAFDNVRLFRWIGLAREYVPNDDLKPHTECLIMTREYIITVILLTVQRMSLSWGQEVATKVGWCADRPRRLPLFRFIDDYPDWDEKKRELHTWHRVLFTVCNLPWMLMPQFVFIVMLVALYLRSNTFMGWVYFFSVLVCLHSSNKTRRHTSSLLGIIIVILVTAQYFLFLGFPNTDDSSLDPLWPWADVLSPASQEWLLIHMADTTGLVIDVILLYFLCAYRALRPEDKTFMTVFIPTEEYKTRNLEKKHKNHFSDKGHGEDDENPEDEETVNLVEAKKAAKERELGRKGKKKEKKNSEEVALKDEGDEKEEGTSERFDSKAFPNTPRKGTNTARYVFYRAIVILVLVALFAVGCARTSIISLIYLIFTVVMAMKHDFLLNNMDPWKKLLRITYVLLAIQMIIQLVSVIILEVVDDHESTFKWLGPLTRVIGIDYTTEGAVTPTRSVLYLVSVLGVVAIVHVLNVDLAEYFKLVRQYIDHGQKRSADSAIHVYKFSMDVIIAKLREIFQEKAERRSRLEHLRESRKHKGMLFPELMRVIGDGSSSSGSSQLSIEEQRMMHANAAKEGSESDEEDKTPFKVHCKILLYKIRNLLIRAVDKIIFLLHGKEGEVEGNRFARDLAILHEDHKKLSEPIKVDPLGNEIKEDNQNGDDDPNRPRLTKAALSGINKAYDAEQLLLRAKETLKMLHSQDAEVLDEIHDIESESGFKATLLTLARNPAVSKMIGNMKVGDFVNAWTNQEARIVAIVQRSSVEEDDGKEISIGELSIVYPFVRDSGSVKNIANVFMGDLFSVIFKDPKAGNVDDSAARDISTSKADSAAAAVGAGSDDSVNGGDIDMSELKQESEDEVAKTGSGRSSRWRLFYKGLYICLCLHTESICMLAFIICHLANGTILSLMYVLFGFAYLVIAPRPLPKKKAWTAVSIYTAVIIGLKYISQMPGMCICRGESIHYHYMSVDIMNGDWTNITCPQAECIMDAGIVAETYSPMYFFGIVPSNAYFGSVIFWDVIVFFACVLHIYLMERQGLWSRPYSAIVDKQQKRFNHTLISLRREAVMTSPTHVIAIEKVVNTDSQFLSFDAGDIIKVLLRGKKKGLTTIGDIDGKPGIFDLSKTRPYFGNADQEEDYQRSESLVNGAEEAGDMNEERQDEEETALLAERKPASGEGGEAKKDGDGAKKKKKKRKTMEERLAESKPGSWTHFYLNTMFNKSRLGKNYYTPMFLSEFICFIYLLFAASNFTGSSGSLISYIEQSYLPGAYVFVLLVQFIIIIVDRIIYLRRSVFAKLILQYVSLIGLNAIMLWYFPSCMSLSNDPEHWKSSFSSSGSLLVFFLFKCIYWQLSGMQIRDGYPMLSCERFLQKKCTTPRKILYIIYRWIPFAYEMRTILDWTFIPTTLSFMDYLRIEDIYGDLFKIGCTVNAQKPRKPGTPQSIVTKSIVGCLFFLLLCCILWLPLIIMSSALSGMGAISISPATEVQVSMGISGWPPFYSQTLTQKSNIGEGFNSSEFSALRRGREFIRSDSSSVQRIRFSNFSGSLWGLTPPAKEEMLKALENIETDAVIETKIVATRKSASNQVVSFSHGVKLDRVQRDNFLKVLYGGNGATFTVEGLIPRFITLPGSTGDSYSPCEQSATSSQCKPIVFNITYYGCFDTYACNITSEGWDFWGIEEKPEDSKGLFSSSVVEIVFIHTPVSSSSNVLGTLAAYGIVGIYVTLIIAIANVVRGMTSEVSHEIMFVMLPNPFELIQTCRDIILARMDGDLLLEEELSNELIQIYRSPEEIKRHSEIQVQEEQNDEVEEDENDIADDED